MTSSLDIAPSRKDKTLWEFWEGLLEGLVRVRLHASTKVLLKVREKRTLQRLVRLSKAIAQLR